MNKGLVDRFYAIAKATDACFCVTEEQMRECKKDCDGTDACPRWKDFAKQSAQITEEYAREVAEGFTDWMRSSKVIMGATEPDMRHWVLPEPFQRLSLSDLYSEYLRIIEKAK